jgi:3-oxoacyl-[acyl-carrier protein] reductase
VDLGLDGRRVLVTAGSQGIGRATALAFAAERARVAICARDPEAIARTAGELTAAGARDVCALSCDLADAQSIDAMLARVLEAFGGVDVLVNNAGGPPPGRSGSFGDEQWQRAFDLTLMSAVRVTRGVLPGMRAQCWGRIVNVSSYSIRQPIPDLMLSNSLRLGVAGWAKSLATELAPDNVLVNTVAPGWTRTGRVTRMLESRAAAGNGSAEQAEAGIVAAVPLRRMAEPAEIADVIVFLSSERASYVTGTVVPVDGGAQQSPT